MPVSGALVAAAMREEVIVSAVAMTHLSSYNEARFIV